MTLILALAGSPVARSTDQGSAISAVYPVPVPATAERHGTSQKICQPWSREKRDSARTPSRLSQNW